MKIQDVIDNIEIMKNSYFPKFKNVFVKEEYLSIQKSIKYNIEEIKFEKLCKCFYENKKFINPLLEPNKITNVIVDLVLFNEIGMIKSVHKYEEKDPQPKHSDGEARDYNPDRDIGPHVSDNSIYLILIKLLINNIATFNIQINSDNIQINSDNIQVDGNNNSNYLKAAHFLKINKSSSDKKEYKNLMKKRRDLKIEQANEYTRIMKNLLSIANKIENNLKFNFKLLRNYYKYFDIEETNKTSGELNANKIKLNAENLKARKLPTLGKLIMNGNVVVEP